MTAGGVVGWVADGELDAVVLRVAAGAKTEEAERAEAQDEQAEDRD